MKAITVQQPWAWSMFYADPPKLIENRTRIGTWLPAVGTTVAIHAGKRWSDRGGDNPIYRRSLAKLPAAVRHLIDVRGAVLGLVDVEDVHPSAGCCSPWGEQSYLERAAGGERKRVDVVHLVLTNPRPLERPVPCRGALGLWTVPEDLAFEVLLEGVPS